MSGDLTLHKRTLTPLSTMIYALRRYDLDRAVAATPEAQDGKDVKVTGFCSHQCKVYLADVYDHMEYILSSMDMFSSIAENLINFTFNVSLLSFFGYVPWSKTEADGLCRSSATRRTSRCAA
jgi:hypothetical protein